MDRSTSSAAARREPRFSPRYRRRSRSALERALAEVPGYAPWRPLDPGPGANVDARYRALPALTKPDLRARFPDGYVPRRLGLAAGLAAGEVELAETSGSTGDRVTIVFDPAWWAQSEQAAWGLNRHARRIATGEHREVVLASPRCVGPGYTGADRPRAERTLGRHLYLNQKPDPALWTGDDIRRMVDEYHAYEPVAIEADPAYLAAFARRVTAMGLALRAPRMVFLTYSYPSRLYRRALRRLFRAPIASSYGSTETGHVFMECERGRLHQNVEHCRVDFEPFLARHGGPRRGRLLVTTFRNRWFPAVRFDIGDVARLAQNDCPCGRREGFCLAAIEGRIHDVTLTGDGDAVTVDRVDAAMARVPGLHAWQIDFRPGRCRLRLVAERGEAGPAARAAGAALRGVYGPGVAVEARCVPALDPEPSGKFRFARWTVPFDWSTLWRHPR